MATFILGFFENLTARVTKDGPVLEIFFSDSSKNSRICLETGAMYLQENWVQALFEKSAAPFSLEVEKINDEGFFKILSLKQPFGKPIDTPGLKAVLRVIE